MTAKRRLLAAAVTAAVQAGPSAQAADLLLQLPQGGAMTLPVTSWRDMPFRTVVRQQWDFSCGSAALATLLHHHYGVEADETTVMTQMYAVGDQLAIQKSGFSLLDMRRYLNSRGFRAEGYRLPLEVLSTTQTPAIALITTRNYRHFVVIKGVQNGRVLVGDPALGLRVVHREDFERMWDGILFVIRGVETGELAPPVFDAPSEWRQVGGVPQPMGLQDGASVAKLTMEFPLQYQILPPPSPSLFTGAQ